MGHLNKSWQSETTREVIELLQLEKTSKNVVDSIQKILEKQDLNIKIWNLLREHIEKAKKFAVVIYEEQEDWREKPIYWSKKMENMSGYIFDEIIAKYNNWESIMELFYWHDQDQIEKISERFKRIKDTWTWYENFVCTLRTARWTIIEVAWNTERSHDNKYRISFWSEDYTDVQRMLRMHDFLPCLKKSALKKDFRDYILNKRWKIEEARSVLALAMIDIDDFKLFNEVYWHAAWDHVLAEFVKFFNSKLRDWDHIYSLGWDEFAILFNTTKHDQIIERVSRIKDEFNSINFIVENGQIINSIKRKNHQEAQDFYEKNREITNWQIFLPPIWLSIWVSDFNYANLRKISTNPDEVNSILERELEKLKMSTDEILIIAKHCYLLNNEQYKIALDSKKIQIDSNEQKLIKNESWEIKEFAMATITKKCKNFIWTPIINNSWQITWVNILTNNWTRELCMKKIAIIKRRKEKLFSKKDN